MSEEKNMFDDEPIVINLIKPVQMHGIVYFVQANRTITPAKLMKNPRSIIFDMLAQFEGMYNHFMAGKIKPVEGMHVERDLTAVKPT